MPVSQFGEPRGLRGWLTARLVARLTGEANRWMVECLDIGPGDRFLDVGCGPGLALAYAAEATDGLVVGVDASPTMVHLARRRTRALGEGRVRVHQADATSLPFPDASFRRVGSLNSLQFWPAPDQGLQELHRVLEPGGRLALVLMARSDEPDDVDTPAWVEELAHALRATGFEGVRIASRTFGGVVHRALLGSRAPARRGALLNPTADGARKGAGP